MIFRNFILCVGSSCNKLIAVQTLGSSSSGRAPRLAEGIGKVRKFETARSLLFRKAISSILDLSSASTAVLLSHWLRGG